ncbi:MAG: BatA domain-containing protein [Planctomycetota bacterium]
MGIGEPLALVALLAAAAPLLLHLRLRRAARTARFPNVELVRSAARDVGRERIVADAWLLVARAGTVALAALAVARPFVGERPPASDPLAGRRIVVALDRSGAWPSREAFEEARAAAADLLDLGGARAGRAALLPFDDLPGPLVESEAARRAIEEMRPTGRARSLGPALDAAARVSWPSSAAGAPGPRTVFLLTTPEGADEALTTTRSLTGPATRLIVFAPATGERARPAVVIAVKIADARLAAPPARAAGEVREELRAGVRVEVRLRRRGVQAPAGACGLRLYFDDDDRAAGGEDAPAAEAVVLASEFAPSGVCETSIEAPRPRPGALLARVEVSVSGARGGSRFLLVPPADRLRILCLTGGERGASDDAALNDARLMKRALEALAAASGSSRAVLPIEAASGAARGVEAGGLRAFDAVVVGDVGAVGPGGWDELERFVRSGGAVIAAAPRGLPAEARRLFGVTGAVERVASPEGYAVALAAAGPDRAEALGFLDGTRFPSRLVLEAPPSGEVALVFGDGAPALVVRRVGRGRAGLFAAGLGALARRPSVLVPFVDALLKRVGRRPEPPLVLSPADAPAVVELDADSAPGGVELVAPDGRRVDAALVYRPLLYKPVVHGPRAAGRAFALLPCEGPGLWRLVARGGASGGRTLRLIGVNAPAVPEPGPRAPHPAQVVRSRAELLAEASGGGPVELGPVFALLALAALAAELALLESRAHGRATRPSDKGGARPTPPSRGGDE